MSKWAVSEINKTRLCVSALFDLVNGTTGILDRWVFREKTKAFGQTAC